MNSFLDRTRNYGFDALEPPQSRIQSWEVFIGNFCDLHGDYLNFGGAGLDQNINAPISKKNTAVSLQTSFPEYSIVLLCILILNPIGSNLNSWPRVLDFLMSLFWVEIFFHFSETCRIFKQIRNLMFLFESGVDWSLVQALKLETSS